VSDEAVPPREPLPGNAGPSGVRGLVHDLLAFPRGALVILVVVPIVLTLLDYYGMPWHYPRHRARRPALTEWKMRPAEAPLASHLEGLEMPGPEAVGHYVWWGAACLAFLVLLPMLAGWLGARASPRALGIPVLYLVSLDPDFQRTYPFFKPQGNEIGTAFLVFEIVYCLQFFAVEFFFRGFMVLGLKPYLGRASVLAMLAPYCMIHYYKPMPEALGAIAAGLVLGSLAWRTGTILYGWALHYAVALTMDLLGLYHRGIL
jgi:hypothetical protein